MNKGTGSIARIHEARTTTPRIDPEIKSLMGNEAIARGAWEAGVKVGAAYPGTPSTEIMESLGTYPAEDLDAQWSTNEKVSLDVAIGASLAGVRAMCAMKHVGLNVASDSLMSQSYIGVNGGLVLVVCDDPGMHSSQNEQDTRLFGQFAMVPVLEPSDAQEAKDFTKLAFELSEKFDTPVIVRSTTRLSHCRSPVVVGEREQIESRGFRDSPAKHVALPTNARVRHPIVLERERKLKEYLNTSDLVRWEPGSDELGVITLSTCYTYVREVIPEASVLKLGVSYPLAEDVIRRFCDSVERVIVVEELEPFIERELRAMGIEVEGKKYFPRVGELSPENLREGLHKAGIISELPKTTDLGIEPVARPPVLCAGCSHAGTYMVLRTAGARVMGDIGCYTLGAIEPLKAMDACVSMGASIGMAVGMAKAGATDKPVVATIGDSTFLHAGIPALIDAVYNNVNITVLLLDNQTVAMTGGQDHAGTGRTLRGDETHRVDFEKVIRAIGVKWVKTVDSYDIGSLYQTYREATQYDGVAVVISNRPCALDPVKIKGTPFYVRSEGCTACQACMNLACPAISWSDELFDGHHKVKINQTTCIGCSMCAQVCPTDCIQLSETGTA
ncbi:MAG: indolepyruvate ferredoxin oxidoreductase subunit alpha [Arenicellales bacterium]|nr:indolepyruvate ferredoxin oxidoreductase subunit alpha [Arenicellales bacterium]